MTMTILDVNRTALAKQVLGEDGYRRAIRKWGIWKQRPRVGHVRFGQLRRTEPICREYGFARGLPIDRYYIENFLDEERALVTGRVLEIGERTYTERFGHDVTASDMSHFNEVPGATYAADLTDAPHIPGDTYDCIIITQTLQFIFDMRAAVATLHRILAPGGVVLCTVPGISQIADPDWQASWSLNDQTARWLFATAFDDSDLKITTNGNVLSATAFLHGLATSELTTDELDVVDTEYPVTVTIVARKGAATPESDADGDS
jgi:SAM-dependent methyltransferase